MLVVNTVTYLTLNIIINNYYINKYYLKLMHDKVYLMYTKYIYTSIEPYIILYMIFLS